MLTSGIATSRRNTMASPPKVRTTAAIDAQPNEPNQCASGGIRPAKNTRFDGLAIGRVRLAEVATSAQADADGRGFASDSATASKTGGAGTLSVASLRTNRVVATATPD